MQNGAEFATSQWDACIWKTNLSINPYKMSGISHYYQFIQSIFVLGLLGVFFIFILNLIEHTVSKQWRPWSDAAFCGVCSRSALFAHVLQKGRKAHIGCTLAYFYMG